MTDDDSIQAFSDPLLLAQASPAGLAWLAGNGQWIPYEHLILLNEYLLRVAKGEIDRLLVSMPPQHGKSELISHYAPAWFIGRYGWPVILCSYEAEFAASWGGKARDVIREYGDQVFGVHLKGRDASHWWEASNGGRMMTAGVGGPITGKGAKLIIIDDPVKNAEEAQSVAFRKRNIDWWDSTARTRLAKDGRVVAVQTRWHEEDLAGYLGMSSEWTVLNLPALAEKDDVMGRAVGEPLCPARYDLAALERIRDGDGLHGGISSYFWNAMYQGRPAAEEGGLFKRHWWMEYDFLPDCSYGATFVDMAHEEKNTADFSVLATWVWDDTNRYCIDVVRRRMEFPALERAVREARYTHDLPIVIEETPGSKPLIQLMQKGDNPIDRVIPWKIEGRSKLARWSAATPLAEAGNLYLPLDAPWKPAFVEEHAAAPNGTHDDQVDTTAMMAIYSARNRVAPRILVGAAPYRRYGGEVIA